MVVDTKVYLPNGLLEDIKELNYRKIQNGKAGGCLLKTDDCFNSFFLKVSHNKESKHPVTLHHASFKWNPNPAEPTTLRSLSWSVPEGALVRKLPIT